MFEVILKKEQDRNKSKDFKNYMRAELSPARQSGMIVSWIINWPFSLVENLFGDIIDFLNRIVTVYLRKIYNSILDSELNKIGD